MKDKRAQAIIAQVAKKQIEQKYGSVANGITQMSKKQKIIISCSCSKHEWPMEEFREKIAEWMKPFSPNLTIRPAVPFQCMKCFDICTTEIVDEANRT